MCFYLRFQQCFPKYCDIFFFEYPQRVIVFNRFHYDVVISYAYLLWRRPWNERGLLCWRQGWRPLCLQCLMSTGIVEYVQRCSDWTCLNSSTPHNTLADHCTSIYNFQATEHIKPYIHIKTREPVSAYSNINF